MHIAHWAAEVAPIGMVQWARPTMRPPHLGLICNLERRMPHERRQYVRFAFYQVDRAWRQLASEERARACRQFADTVDEWSGRILLRTYSTLGMRADCDFMLWQVSENLDDFQAL